MPGKDDWLLPFASALGVSDFADQALILPLAVGTGLLLAVSGWRRGAFAWTAAIGTTLVLVLLLKLRFFACGHIFDETARGNPSGHTAAAAAVYGGLTGLVVGAIWDNMRWSLSAAVLTGAMFAVVIGQSRLLLDRHTMAEVVVGAVIGIGGAAGFVVLAGSPPHAVRVGRIVGTGIVLIAFLHGFRLSAESMISSMAPHLWPFSQCL
jgi:membrane-associated phospholipid phosphatase